MDNPWDKGWEPQVLGLNKDLEQRLAECRIELRKKTDQLRAMVSELAQVEQRERERMATILHDNLQQLLVAAFIQIGVVSKVPLPIRGRAALSKAGDIINRALTVSRELTVDLSPPLLHGAGLGLSLQWVARQMADLHCFTVNLSIDPRAEPQTESLRVLLFESVRELLFNSCKHSGCATALATITRGQNGWVRVVVEDAGKGFDPQVLSTSMANGETRGLFRIRQRLACVGARMSMTSEPGAGTRVEVLAPIDCEDQTGHRFPGEGKNAAVVRENETKVINDAISV
jgi:signal transduction histidine kinase